MAGTRENKGGRWAGTLENKGGKQEAAERDVGVMRGGGRQENEGIKFFNDFLVCFRANYQKSEPKNIHYLLV